MTAQRKCKQPNLKLIQGGLQQSTAYGSLEIVAAPENAPPFPVQATTREEDTFLIMSPAAESTCAECHPIRLMAELEHFEPETVGTVLVRKTRPVQFLAVVHDVNQEPACREAWVEQAIQGVFHEADRLKLSALAMPLLATRHGRIPLHSFARLFGRALQNAPLTTLEKIWLIAPLADNGIVIHALNEHLKKSAQN